MHDGHLQTVSRWFSLKTTCSHGPCYVYFCLLVLFVWPPLEKFFLFGVSRSTFMELLVRNMFDIVCQDSIGLTGLKRYLDEMFVFSVLQQMSLLVPRS
jgi:hypothetical protein